MYPTSTPSFSTPSSSETLQAAGHTALHIAEINNIIAFSNKIGTGASTPTAGIPLVGTGAGTSAWQPLSLTTGVSGILSVNNGGTGTTSTTGTGSNVFQTSPTINTPTLTNPTTTNLTNSGGLTNTGGLGTDTLNSSGAATIAGLLTPTGGVANNTISPAALLNGLIAQRQGGTTGNASWQTNGTSNTNTSTTNVFIQVGVGNVAGAETTVTFPVAFNQVPIIIGSPNTATSQNSFFRARLVTTTGFIAILIVSGTTATPTTSENFAWMAIGQ